MAQPPAPPALPQTSIGQKKGNRKVLWVSLLLFWIICFALGVRRILSHSKNEPSDSVTCTVTNEIIVPQQQPQSTIPPPVKPPRQTEKPTDGTQNATDENEKMENSAGDGIPLTTKGIPMTHCGTLAGPTSPMVQYGNFLLTIVHCAVAGTQIRVSGTIHYRENPEAQKRLVVFHRFQLSDEASGAVYTVQSGQFGSSHTFGTGYSWEWMEPGSTLGFSFVAGTVSSPPNGIHFNIPNNQAEEGFSFNDLMERAD